MTTPPPPSSLNTQRTKTDTFLSIEESGKKCKRKLVLYPMLIRQQSKVSETLEIWNFKFNHHSVKFALLDPTMATRKGQVTR